MDILRQLASLLHVLVDFGTMCWSLLSSNLGDLWTKSISILPDGWLTDLLKFINDAIMSTGIGDIAIGTVLFGVFFVLIVVKRIILIVTNFKS